MDQERIGKFIAGARNQAGLTQKELAEQIGVSDKTISKWECGKSMPDISYLDALCNSLDISMNELISGERLSETDYSTKAEENIMALMKENEKNRNGSAVKTIIGIALAVVSLFLMLFLSSAGNWQSIFLMYLDFVTLIFLVLLSVAGVLISGKKSFAEILRVLQKISIPNGVLVTLISVVIVFSQLDSPATLGPNLAVCILSMIYAVIEYLIVLFIREHVMEEK